MPPESQGSAYVVLPDCYWLKTIESGVVSKHVASFPNKYSWVRKFAAGVFLLTGL